MGHFGTSIKGVTDTDKSWGLVSGAKAIGDALARRFTTATGSLFYDLGYGYDIRQFLNAPITEANRRLAVSQLEEQALQDERIDSVTVTLEKSRPDEIKITVSGILSDESAFSLVLSVNQLTVDLLQVT